MCYHPQLPVCLGSAILNKEMFPNEIKQSRKFVAIHSFTNKSRNRINEINLKNIGLKQNTVIRRRIWKLSDNKLEMKSYNKEILHSHIGIISIKFWLQNK